LLAAVGELFAFVAEDGDVGVRKGEELGGD